jgi:hypothetical protein
VIEILQFIATLSAALFAGAALYINVAEHPARMSLQTQMAALQWAPSYQRATWLQAPLALASLVCGVSVWLLGGSPYWAMAAALVGAVVPVTFLVIMPTNHRLMTPGRDLTSPETRELLLRWGHLHAMSTILSVAGLVMYLCLLIA